MPSADREIWTVANLYVKRHGSEALARAGERASELAAAGDAEGRAIWVLVTHAIEKIQRPQRRDQG